MLWCLSPPCQPFTRQGLKKDAHDPRAFSFLSLLNKLLQMKKSIPEYLCVENVVGFESSFVHDRMIETFQKCGFSIFEWILSPDQFGLPYSRPRYFCLARRRPFRHPSNNITFQNPPLETRNLPVCTNSRVLGQFCRKRLRRLREAVWRMNRFAFR